MLYTGCSINDHDYSTWFGPGPVISCGFFSWSHYHTAPKIQNGPHLTFRIWKKSAVKTAARGTAQQCVNRWMGQYCAQTKKRTVAIKYQALITIAIKDFSQVLNAYVEFREKVKFKCFMT